MSKPKRSNDKFLGLLNTELFTEMVQESIQSAKRMEESVDDAYVKTMLTMLYKHLDGGSTSLVKFMKNDIATSEELYDSGIQSNRLSFVQIQICDAWLTGFSSGFSNAVINMFEEVDSKEKEILQ